MQLLAQTHTKAIRTTSELVRLFSFQQELSLFHDIKLLNLNGIWRILVWPQNDRPDPLLRPCIAHMYHAHIKDNFATCRFSPVH